MNAFGKLTGQHPIQQLRLDNTSLHYFNAIRCLGNVQPISFFNFQVSMF